MIKSVAHFAVYKLYLNPFTRVVLIVRIKNLHKNVRKVQEFCLGLIVLYKAHNATLLKKTIAV